MIKCRKLNHILDFSGILKIYGIKIKKKPNITIKEFNENKEELLTKAEPKIITKVIPVPRKIDLKETEFVIISNDFTCKYSIVLYVGVNRKIYVFFNLII
ncbi:MULTISPECIES: hypothetical protein [Bacillus cereus group]|uniref:hypothetical protein n=1 Tax=Bacillus cereus group TaxID=86661 RepID=UPI0005B63885|nr:MULTISPECIES: hypothetical protein [Bacillus cereus group]MEB9670581.1 hypothetical protein [Bacillus anthracis]